MTWDIHDIQKWSWRKHPLGGVIEDPGNSSKFKTGGWRTFRPVRNALNCNQCLICYIYCPDSSIIVEDGNVTGINYDFCKGCGICATECPRDAIEMKDEGEETDKQNK